MNLIYKNDYKEDFYLTVKRLCISNNIPYDSLNSICNVLFTSIDDVLKFSTSFTKFGYLINDKIYELIHTNQNSELCKSEDDYIVVDSENKFKSLYQIIKNNEV